MRIISICIEPVARIIAFTYAVFGLASFLMFAVSSKEYLTLPFGVLAPLVQLNINFNLPRSSGIPYNLLLCVASISSYAVTGWITGAVAALCFNIAAKKMGGIDAKYFRAETATSGAPD